MSEFTPERIAKDNDLIENTSLLPWIFQENEYDGKNWLLFTMSFGLGHDGKEHNLYVTTDHAKGDDLGTADSDAEYVLLACNEYPEALDEITALSARVQELSAENTKLREALQKVTKDIGNLISEMLYGGEEYHLPVNQDDVFLELEKLLKIAEGALE